MAGIPRVGVGSKWGPPVRHWPGHGAHRLADGGRRASGRRASQEEQSSLAAEQRRRQQQQHGSRVGSPGAHGSRSGRSLRRFAADCHGHRPEPALRPSQCQEEWWDMPPTPRRARKYYMSLLVFTCLTLTLHFVQNILTSSIALFTHHSNFLPQHRK